ncbi:sorting nexin-19-like isoform X2 [Oncorhynchus keta]|uniref:sorting nexin-19-like isoform X2 n=1 Tax=Oncorhynchus keta TaxID=8018 RepID=UPI00227CF58E|nr:sorting nexin-19-like isoform X2 [Oncorhynchus keta]
MICFQPRSVSALRGMPPPEGSGPNPNHWALSELLGQRRLVVLGVLVAWMVLFHLLVNVWLLCLFTSLLVVLGGWLGSRAALDANSLLHLEHFVPLGRSQPALHSPESEWRLDHEIQSAVHKAIRDFVSSWYHTMLTEEEGLGEFEHIMRDAMLDSVMELKERARCVDRRALVQRTLELCGCHLQSYMTAREMMKQAEAWLGMQDRDSSSTPSLWELYSQADAPHPALASPATELSYSRAVVDLLMQVLVPFPHLETRTGRYMVGELITCNVLLPLVSRVSDPDWLNLTIVDLFTKAKESPDESLDELPDTPVQLHRSQTQQELWTQTRSTSWLQTPRDQNESSNSPTPPKPATPDSLESMESYHTAVPDLKEETRQYCGAILPMPCIGSSIKINSCHVSMDLLRSCSGGSRLYQVVDSDLESPSTESNQLSVESLDQMDSEEDQTDSFCDCTSPTNFCSVFEDEPPGCFGNLKVLGPKVSEQPHWPAGMAEELPPGCPVPPGRLCLTPFSFEPLSSPDGPVLIQNLRITGAVTAKEHRSTGSHPYTLYTVKYETVVDSESLGTLQPVAYHTVNRRYSEFLHLQTRLEEKPDLRKMIKNVKGPKKIFPDLPFGNPDIDKVEVRKGQLDTFLKQLCTIPETANSDEMQQFLALHTDASTAFEKKPFVMSRIDKMMANAVDTLKTAFPRAEDDLDGEPADARNAPEGRKRSVRLRFSSKVAPTLNIPEIQPRVIYCFNEGSTVFHGLSLSGLEGFIKDQEALLYAPQEKEADGRRFSVLPGKDRKGGGGRERKLRGTDTAVADVALNILCLLMKDQWSWLCTENIQKTIRLLFGTFIERWLDVGMAHLTSAPCWVIYLQVMQEAVWPGGVLPDGPRPDRSLIQREETRQQCLHCLTQLLPDLIADMLGSEKYRVSWDMALASLQDPNINRHLIYCICDLLLEFLIPESSEEGFQRSLLHSLFGDEERLSASA